MSLAYNICHTFEFDVQVETYDWIEHCKYIVKNTENRNIQKYINDWIQNLFIVSTLCGPITSLTEAQECQNIYGFPVALCKSVLKYTTIDIVQCINVLMEQNVTFENFRQMCDNEVVAQVLLCKPNNELNALLYNVTNFMPNDYELNYFSYFYPCISLLEFLLNSLLIAVFLRERFFSSAHVFLISIAMFDLMYSLSTTPTLLYFVTLGNYRRPVYYIHCLLFEFIFNSFCPLLHGCRVWVMVGFSLCRYGWFKHSTVGRRILSYRRLALLYILGVMVGCLLMMIPNILDLKDFQIITVYLEDNTPLKTTWKRSISAESGSLKPYPYSAILIRGIFLHLVPCLIIITIAVKVRQAHLNLANVSDKPVERQTDSSNRMRFSELQIRKFFRTTVILVLFFIVTEIPFAVLGTAIYAFYMSNGNFSQVGKNVLQFSLFIANVIRMLSGMMNFTIYTLESPSFRQRLLNILSCGIKKRRIHRQGFHTDVDHHTIADDVIAFENSDMEKASSAFHNTDS